MAKALLMVAVVIGCILRAEGSNCVSEPQAEQLPPCEVTVTVLVGQMGSSNGSSWRCPTLQGALHKAVNLSMTLSEEDESSVRVAIPAGRHMITAPLDFGSASVALVGSEEATTVFCNYTVMVDPKRIFDSSYFYIDYTLNFVESGSVSFDSVEFVGCPYPLRLERVKTVAVHNSTFQ